MLLFIAVGLLAVALLLLLATACMRASLRCRLFTAPFLLLFTSSVAASFRATPVEILAGPHVRSVSHTEVARLVQRLDCDASRGPEGKRPPFKTICCMQV